MLACLVSFNLSELASSLEVSLTTQYTVLEANLANSDNRKRNSSPENTNVSVKYSHLSRSQVMFRF